MPWTSIPAFGQRQPNPPGPHAEFEQVRNQRARRTGNRGVGPERTKA